MTAKDLMSAYWLKHEVDTLTEQMENIRARCEKVTSGVSADRVQTTRNLRSWEGYAIALAQIEDRVDAKITECLDLYKEIYDWINSIDDSRVRQIIILRYIGGLTWNKVADEMGGGNSEDTVRKAAARYIAQHCD